ncbi:hypothetical protein B5M43_002950 [Microbacterium sp. MEC084]|uniref:hypothetical protein n=1 Tax=Microbacterium sp. MEC084 TaxID=1963027 RepID=UPI0010701BEE|nr:hypothetical protein [Microbacterium sp. MEC084]MCD1267805.1 hypothetical protein [Microbacterium sp. MEC084]
MAKTESRWNELVRTTLASIPDDVLERIRSVQPFMASDPQAFALPLLHELDLDDKHRAALQIHLTARDRQTLMLMMRFQAGHPIEGDPIIQDGYEFLADGLEVRNGLEIASGYVNRIRDRCVGLIRDHLGRGVDHHPSSSRSHRGSQAAGRVASGSADHAA